MFSCSDAYKKIKNAFTERDVYLSPAELPEQIIIPDNWKDFGLGIEKKPVFPSAWYLFSEQLPWVLSLLDIGLLGTAILGGPRLELLYIFHDANGLYYYTGGEPLNNRTSPNPDALKFGGKMAEFYTHVHNGFTFHPAQSMGPQKVENFSYISDLIDEEDTSFAARWLTVFSNGGGDYLALDLSHPAADKGIIWWHEQPLDPELHVDVFLIMNAWISIFLEDTLARDDVLKADVYT